jgi:hypothetical protein
MTRIRIVMAGCHDFIAESGGNNILLISSIPHMRTFVRPLSDEVAIVKDEF